jgi:MFS family permease
MPRTAISPPSAWGPRARRWGLPAVGPHRPFVIAMVIDTVGTGLYMPFTVLYFTATTSLSIAQVGLGLSIAAAVGLLLSPMLGGSVDANGAKPVLVASNGIRVAGYAAAPLVGGMWSLVAVTLAMEIGMRAFWASYVPLVAEIAAPQERPRWFGFLTSVRNAGLGLGSLMAGVAVAFGGGGAYDVIVLLNASSFALAGWLIWVTPVAGRASDPAPSSGAWQTVLTDRPYLALTLVNLAYTLSMVSLTILLPVYVVETLALPTWLAGAVIALNCVLMTVAQGPAVRLIEHRTTIWALRLSAALFSVAFIVIAVVSWLPLIAAVPVLLAGVVVFTFGELFESPSMAALSTDAAPTALRGRYLTMHQTSWTIASIIGPALFTLLLSVQSVLPWLFLAVLSGVGTVTITAVGRLLAPRL